MSFTSFENLPREILIHVLKCSMDMETRIKAGIIHPLKVPQSLLDKLNGHIAHRLQGMKTHDLSVPITAEKCYKCYYGEEYKSYFWYLAEVNMLSYTLMYPKLKFPAICTTAEVGWNPLVDRL